MGTPFNGYDAHALEWPGGAARGRSAGALGMSIEYVGEKLGTASGTKILRSVLIKGIEALVDEMVLAARVYGLDEAARGLRLQDPDPAVHGHR